MSHLIRERLYYILRLVTASLSVWPTHVVLSCHFAKCVHMCQSCKCLAGLQRLSGGWLAWPISAFGRLNHAAVRSSGQGHGMRDGGPGRTKSGQRQQAMTFTIRPRGLELRIEKLNSYPCAEGSDRQPCLSVSFFCSSLIHHFIAVTDNDLESSFIAAKFASRLRELWRACAAERSIV